MQIQIAWKNLFRYKRRTLITSFAISCGVFFTMLLAGLLDGMNNESYINMIEYETASSKIYSPEYFEKREEYPFDIFIEKEESDKIENILNSNNLYFTPSVLSPCEIYFNEDYFETSGSINAILCGIDIEKSKDVYRFSECIEEGSWLKKDNDEPYCTGAIVGSWIATDMIAKVGYYITIECKGKDGFSQTFDIPIVGIIQCPNNKINAGMIFMDLDYINEMLELNGAVTEYAISAKSVASKSGVYSISSADKISSSVKTEFAHAQNLNNLKAYSWRDINSEIISLQKNISSMSNLMMIFMFIIAAVGISNTMLMAVLERKNEVAMLKAMGYSPFYIKTLFMWEGIFIGLLGCVFGFFFGCLANIPLAKNGIDFTNMLSDIDMGYRISGLLRSTWNFKSFIRITVGALIISAFSAYLPTRSTVKKEVAEIFRKN